MTLSNLWFSPHGELRIGVGLLGEGAEQAFGFFSYTPFVPPSLHGSDISHFSLHQPFKRSLQ